MEHENVALQHALEMLRDGHLSIDGEGRIWRNACFWRGRWTPVKPRRAENVGGKGYLRLTLQIDGRLRSVMAHRIIWWYLEGPIPPQMQINHKDLDKTNNRIANLEVVSGARNIQHSWFHGRNKPWSLGGSGTWRGKPLVDEAKIFEVKSLREQGLILKEIARKTDLSISHVHRILNRKE